MENKAQVGFDALLPPEMAVKAEELGVRKAVMGWRNTLALGILAGAFIGLGFVYSLTATAGAAGQLPFGVIRILGGIVFSLGLILVVIAGAELFTGNNLIVMAWANRRISSYRVLRNWTLVYVGNFIGALATAMLMFTAGQYGFGKGAVGLNILNTATAKCSLGFVEAVALGIGCNALVCLAVWICYSARTSTDKILSILFPISAFVATGMEHCVANMFLLPMALMIKAWAPQVFWGAIGKAAADFPGITWQGFLITNLAPVTLGNIVGGAVMVGLVYWFVYLRKGLVPPPDEKGSGSRGDSI